MKFIIIDSLIDLPPRAEIPSGGVSRSYVLGGFLFCGGLFIY
jgi:hypothetical protein